MTKKKLPKAPDYLDKIAKEQWGSKIQVLLIARLPVQGGIYA